MSSGEKAAKGKGKPPSKTKSTKGKEVAMNDQRFRGDGLKFKCKIVGMADVECARGDSMCAEAIKKLKAQALKSHKESGEHKQKIVMYITLKGIRIVDEKTQKVQHEHPINKISFITHDPEDKKIFSYVCSQACTTGHRMYAIKSEKPAGVLTGTLYELFQVVFKLRQEAGLSKKVQNSPQVPNSSSQVSNGAKPSSPANSDGIYEVPYKNGSNKQAKSSPQLDHDDHEYAEPIKPSGRKEKDPHYNVPPSIHVPLPATPSSQTSENSREGVEEKEKTTSADASNPSTLLSQSQSFDKEPDQVSQASIPDSPFPNHDNSSADMAFFGASVFDTTPSESGIVDTVSVASSADVSMLRSNSVSSGSSETQSAHSRSGSLRNQTATTEGVQPGFAATFDNTGDVRPSLDMKTTQEFPEFPDQTLKSQNQGDFPVAFPSLGNEEKYEENKDVQVSTVEETSVASNPDPFSSSTEDNERTKPVAGEGFFTESFAAFDTAFGDFEVKNSDSDNRAKDDLSSSDPFAPSGVTQEQGSVTENVESFASGTSFEAAFSSEPFTPSQPNSDVSPDDKHSDADEKPVEEKRESAVSVSWNNSFGETENESKPDATQSAVTSEVQFSWAESFVSDDVDVTAKTDARTAASFSWDDAFGGAATVDEECSDQAQDAFAWDDGFGGKATDSSTSQFDSSPFGDAFTSSTVESSSDKPREFEIHAEPGPQSTIPDKPPLFGDSAFATPPSSSSESSANVLASGEHKESPVPSKDPFKEFKISFPPPPTKAEKIAPAETENSSGSEVSTPDGDSATTKEIVSIEVPSDENAKETFDMEDTDETVHQAKDHGLESIDENTTEEEQMNEERPSELQILETKLSLSERPISPTAPPPLPPRPVVSAPPLPARPSSSSSTASAGISPINPHLSTDSLTSNSPHHGKKGSAKKTPPPPPPRVDLNEQSASNEKEAVPDPFGSDLFHNQFGDSKAVDGGDTSDWTASWPSVPELPPKEKTRDPFSDSFFTDFDFPQKPASSTAINDNSDPFTTTNPTSKPFPMAFGNEDLFAAFTPAKVEVAFGSRDPFQKDSSDSFAAFPSDDPFSDISDPFADKGILGVDPFGDSPSKPQMGEALTLNESLVASDEADSFA